MQPLSSSTEGRARRRRLARVLGTSAAAALALAVLVRPTENAVANGETRTLTMQHMHTGESISITYKQDGRFVPGALEKLNWFLRDWRRTEPTRMDPRLFDTLWLAYHETGATQPIHVVCGYRAPETNAMLRRRSRGVAKFSQHTLGKATDFYIPGVNLATLRVAGLRLQRGGVGFYPQSNFVHLDVGSVRMWPRMSFAELSRVFPDGRTVQIAADGRKLPGYQQAFNQIMRNGGSVAGFKGGGEDDGGSGSDDDSGVASTGGNLFASIGSLFGGGGGSTAPSVDSNRSAQAFVMADASRRSGVAQATVTTATVRSRTRGTLAVGSLQAAPQPEPVLAQAVPMPARKPAELLALATQTTPRQDMPRQDMPRMVWQSGMQPVQASAAVETAQAQPLVPLPPSRPAGIVVASAEDAIPAVPLPVPSPLPQMAAADPIPVPVPVPAPPEVVQPEQQAPTQLADAQPAAAAQPATPVLADASADGVAAMLRNNLPRQFLPGGSDQGAGSAPSSALGYAAAEMPIGTVPLRGEFPREHVALVSTPFESLDFSDLAAPLPTASDPSRSAFTMPDLGTLGSLMQAPARTVVMRFGVAAYGDLWSARFSGAAVKPLRTAEFGASYAWAPQIGVAPVGAVAQN